MRKILLWACVVSVVWTALMVVTLWAADLTTSKTGSLHLASGTSDYEVEFAIAAGQQNVRMRGFSLAPDTADIVFRLVPNYGGASESMTVRAGDVLTMDDLENFRGFQIDRTSATAVDVYWWR